MSHMPSGTVTFLFTDIEGSTRKWQNWPQKMKSVLKRHDDILQATIEEHNGYVFKTVGDAFCAAFQKSLDCIEAALAIQLKLKRAVWDLPEDFKVRMAIHTGETIERNKDYFGPVLNRVARLEGVAHGGQIIMTLITAELLRDQLSGSMGLLSLGKHRLKDLTRPEEVFQLTHPELPSDFEPLNSLDNHSHNLSIQPSALIGREEELKEIRRFLLHSDSRVITITGPGGMGKTRISIQAGAELVESYSGGVYFIDLTSINQRDSFFQLICRTLMVDIPEGQDSRDVLVDAIDDKEMLLILDNFEHIMEASALVSLLLSKCSNLSCLVTSREALHIRGEQIYHLPSLSVPEESQDIQVKKLNQYDSVRLFIDRAVEVKSDFQVSGINAPYIAQICSELDGIPLAIELAAARISTLSPRSLLKKLNHRLEILTFGATDLPERHKTIRSTIAWSYELLEPLCQTLFAELSVFQGGFDLEAAESVCSLENSRVLDELEHLIDKNLIVCKSLPDGEIWYYFLETIHEFASDLFEESSSREAVSRHYAEYCYQLTEGLEKGLQSPEQKHWIDKITGFHGNIGTVLKNYGDYLSAEQVISMASSMRLFWEICGPYNEGIDIYRELAADYDDVRLKLGLAALLLKVMSYEEAIESLKSLKEEELDTVLWVWKHIYLGWAYYRINELESSEESFLSAGEKAEENHIKILEGKVLHGRATILWKKGMIDESRKLFSDALTIMKYCGEPRSIAHIANSLGLLYSISEDFAKAEKFFTDALPIFRSLGSILEVRTVLNNMGYLNFHLQQYKKSGKNYKELLNESRNDPYFSGTAYIGLAVAAQKQNKIEQAHKYTIESLKIFRSDNFPGDYGIALRVMGDICRSREDFEQARLHYEEAIPLLRENHEEDDLELAERALEEVTYLSLD